MTRPLQYKPHPCILAPHVVELLMTYCGGCDSACVNELIQYVMGQKGMRRAVLEYLRTMQLVREDLIPLGTKPIPLVVDSPDLKAKIIQYARPLGIPPRALLERIGLGYFQLLESLEGPDLHDVLGRMVRGISAE